MSSPGLQPACDFAVAHAVPRPSTAGHQSTLVLATTILASSLAFIDGSVVNVGLPAIGQGLGAAGGGLAWVVNAYLLPLSALLLLGGAAGDLYGRRRMLIAGVALFALASVLCAFAPSLSALVAGRLVQGIGAAILMPNSLALLGATFTGEERGRAIGIWAAVGAAAGAVGPLVGGWLIDAVGWRAIFAVNLPLAAAAIWLAWRYVPVERPEQRPPLDWAGAALVAAGLGALTWGLTVASQAWSLKGAAAAALAGGVALLAAFLWLERRKGEAALTPLAIFSSRSFVALTILTLLLYGALGALLVLIPYVLIEASGYSATMAGAALLPLPVVIALSSSQMGRLAARIGPRLPLAIGPVVVALGCVLAARIGAGGYWTNTLPALLVIAIGLAGAVAPLTAAVLGSVDKHHTGVASGLNSAVARTGGLIATALAAVVFAAHGPALLFAFRIAVLATAATALAAGAAIWLLGTDLKPAEPGLGERRAG